MRQINSLLRSRRLALALLVGVTVYAVLSTLDQERGAELFGTPVFLAVSIILMTSTAACAWERTRSAAVIWRLRKEVPRGLRMRLEASPHRIYRVEAADHPGALERIERELRKLGMVTTRSGMHVTARSRTWSVWGSPVFHWALAALFVTAAVGQLVRWEGQIGIPVGHGVTDTAESYGSLRRGALAPRSPSTGLTITVPKMDVHYRRDGIERGHAPFVELSQGKGQVRAGLVYPNHPIRRGPLVIHRGEWGIGVVAALETSRHVEVGRRHFLLDFESIDKEGRITVVDGSAEATAGARFTVSVPLDPAPGGGYVGDLPARPRVELGVSAAGESTAAVLSKGERTSLPLSDMTLVIRDVDRYVRLNVVNDPTVPWLYAFLLIGCVGSGVALLLPARAVVAAVETADDGADLKVLVVSKRVDPAFRGRVERQLDRAIVDDVSAAHHGSTHP